MHLKILFISYRFPPDIGGIETVSEILSRAFVEAGHEVRLLTCSVGALITDFPFAITQKPNVYELLKDHAWADVVFENNPSFRLSWPMFFFRSRAVVALHTWLTRSNGKINWQDRLKKIKLRKANRVIACSEVIRRHSWPDAMVISNPYEDDKFRVMSSVNRSREFVFLGRLVSDKGADIAVRAFHQLVNGSHEFIFTSFTIIGEGPEKESLEQMVFELGLKNKVRFKGKLSGESLVHCLNEHRFLLVPSLWEEPFGLVALEGMACGCVPIVSDSGGLPQAIGKAGLTFRKGNAHSLADIMCQVLREPNLVMKLKENAPTHLSNHRKCVVSNHYLTVLENVVASTN